MYIHPGIKFLLQNCDLYRHNIAHAHGRIRLKAPDMPGVACRVEQSGCNRQYQHEVSQASKIDQVGQGSNLISQSLKDTDTTEGKDGNMNKTYQRQLISW